jgi:hypothetical protein
LRSSNNQEHNMRFSKITALLIMVIALHSPLDALAQTFKEELARTALAEATGHGIGAGELKLGPASAGQHELQLTVTSLHDMPRDIRLSVSVFPGLGDAPTRLEKTETIAAAEQRILTTRYTLSRLTPFSRVTVVLESNVSAEATWQQVFRSRAFLGIGNPAVSRDFPEFARKSSRHIDGYFLPGTVAERDIDDILVFREKAVSQISDILDTTFNGRVRLFLYPDAEVKFLHTGHQGMGWAYGDFIAEIYNENQRLDPVHELAHIVTGQFGLLPAFLDEGFATYISEYFGEDALALLGNPGRSVDEVMAELVVAGRSLPIRDLIALENIGNSQETAQIEYPQSASLVKFIVETQGPRAVSSLFKAIGSGGATPAQVVSILESSLGISIDELNEAWVQNLTGNTSP